MIEFQAWPKTPRLFRDAVITEKIDGTNAAIGIADADQAQDGEISKSLVVRVNGGRWLIYAQSRSRIITPEADNFGFAAWVFGNAETLVTDLGPGLHFGEWWGRGIQRGYGLTGRRFSLFNVAKWEGADFGTPCLGSVPVLGRRTFNTAYVLDVLDQLQANGSQAAPGFASPEGVCVYHAASRQVFKALIENDDRPKGLAS